MAMSSAAASISSRRAARWAARRVAAPAEQQRSKKHVWVIQWVSGNEEHRSAEASSNGPHGMWRQLQSRAATMQEASVGE
jgi:hypothetical protein